MNYKKLSNVSIESCGLINTNVSFDSVYSFCKKNNINNIGDFIKIYKEKYDNGEISNKHNTEYIEGMIELLCLVYLNIPLNVDEIFLRKIYIGEYVNGKLYGYMESKYYKSSLRRLGFTNNERNIIFQYVVKNGKEMTVINAIKMYLKEDLGIKLSKKEQIIFCNKLKIFERYYDKGLNFKSVIKSSDLYKIEELLIRYDKLLKKKEEINNNILSIEREVNNLLKDLGNSDIKKLQKKYQNKEFIAKK